MRFIILIFLAFLLTSCLKNQLGKISGAFSSGGAPVVTSVSIVNDQLIVTGTTTRARPSGS